MKNIEWSQESGLQCDYCDFKDVSLKVSQESIGTKCPKCGENLLTREDFELNENFKKSLDIVNSFSKQQYEELVSLFGIDVDIDERIENNKIVVKIHDGINFEII